MTDLLEKAVATARSLPPEMQDEATQVLLDFVSGNQDPYQFTPEETTELDESEAAAARGEFATDEEVRAIWAKHGL